MAIGTGAEFGLSGDDQIRIVSQYIAEHGGIGHMSALYDAVEAELGGSTLSAQGKSSLRFFVNQVAVERGLIQPFDRRNPGWRLTAEGERLAKASADLSRTSAEAVVPDSGEPPVVVDGRQLMQALGAFLEVAESARRSVPTNGIGAQLSLAGLPMLQALLKTDWDFKFDLIRLELSTERGAVKWKLLVEVR